MPADAERYGPARTLPCRLGLRDVTAGEGSSDIRVHLLTLHWAELDQDLQVSRVRSLRVFRLRIASACGS